MALIECQKCGNKISDTAYKCPKCGKRRWGKSKGIFIFLGILIVFAISSFFVIKTILKRVDQKRQAEIAVIEEEMSGLYKKADFDGVENCLDRIDSLKGDTTEQREALEYDRKYYADALNYYTCLKETYDKLDSGGYSSITSVIKTFKDATDRFEKIPINENSEMGRWVKDVKSSSDFVAFNAVMLDGYSETIKDDRNVNWIQASTLSFSMRPLLEYEFPYTKK